MICGLGSLMTIAYDEGHVRSPHIAAFAFDIIIGLGILFTAIFYPSLSVSTKYLLLGIGSIYTLTNALTLIFGCKDECCPKSFLC